MKRYTIATLLALVLVIVGVTIYSYLSARPKLQPKDGLSQIIVLPDIGTATESDWAKNRSVESQVTSPSIHGAPSVTLEPHDQSIDMTWTPVPYADSYAIYRSTTAGREGTAPIATGIDTQPYTDRELKNGTNYYYQVAGESNGKSLTRSAEVCLAPANFSPPAAGLTQSSAILLAGKFCESFGVKASGIPRAVYPYNDNRDGMPHVPEHYYLPRWQVSYSSGAKVELDNANGRIVSLFVPASFPSKPAGVAIPQAKATAIANRIATAVGVKAEIGSKAQAQEEQLAQPPTAQTHQWDFNWERQTADGVLYRDDSFIVMIQAETGIPVAISANFHAAPPDSLTAKVTPGQALSAASRAFASLKFAAGGTPGTPVEMVVQSNGFPNQRPSFDEKRGPARYAWVCRFPVRGGGVEIWIDESTGKVIGGETEMME